MHVSCASLQVHTHIPMSNSGFSNERAVFARGGVFECLDRKPLGKHLLIHNHRLCCEIDMFVGERCVIDGLGTEPAKGRTQW